MNDKKKYSKAIRLRSQKKDMTFFLQTVTQLANYQDPNVFFGLKKKKNQCADFDLMSCKQQRHCAQ